MSSVQPSIKSDIPVILFTYARPEHLRKTLNCLRQNHVPLIYAFSDGALGGEQERNVLKVREMLREVDWCDMVIHERKENLGLGRSILTGVTEMLKIYEAAIIFEDDLICVPGTYSYLCAALKHYHNDDRVMSVTGWTHPLLTPKHVDCLPYFDGRAECWVWGTWSSAWQGMEIDAKTLIEKCRTKGIDIYRYGSDLVTMAEMEIHRNIWAVRLLVLHMLKKGLCLRPPWSMVEHIGFGAGATNTNGESWLKNPPLRNPPPIPLNWPEPLEHPDCSSLNQKAFGERPTARDHFYRLLKGFTMRVLRSVKRK